MRPKPKYPRAGRWQSGICPKAPSKPPRAYPRTTCELRFAAHPYPSYRPAGGGTLIQPERSRRVRLGHPVDIGLRNAGAPQGLEERLETVRMQRVLRLSQVARQDARGRSDGPDRLYVICDFEFLIGPDQGVVDELEIGALPGGLLHLGNRHSDTGEHGVSDDDPIDSLTAGLPDDRETLDGR